MAAKYKEHFFEGCMGIGKRFVQPSLQYYKVQPNIN